MTWQVQPATVPIPVGGKWLVPGEKKMVIFMMIMFFLYDLDDLDDYD